jgi:pantoate--beta-alanine ligase
MRVIKSIAEAHSFARDARARGRSVALVPTMGALHEGHFSLIRQAKRQCDVVVVSIFVNPMQFTSPEDLAAYPRNLSQDIERAEPFRIDAVFAPSEKEMYPDGFASVVTPGEIAKPFEGEFRPGHFPGVATVVIKLLNILRPDITYFGQKDFQQMLVIRRLVEDLNLDVRLVICPTVREADGLAMSSRNARLNSDERKAATAVHRALARAQQLAHGGESLASKLVDAMREVVQSESMARLDYAAVVEPQNLQPVERVTAGTLALVAGRVGQARLIDNLILGPPDARPEMLLQLALTARPILDAGGMIPGLETETARLKIAACRDCAAVATIILPPREFLSSYVKTFYPDRSIPRIAVIGRDAPLSPENFLYRHPDSTNRFDLGLFELIGVKNFAEFKQRFVLTDALRCHCTAPHVVEKGLAYCARHLLAELKLFPNLETLIVLGDDAYLQFQRHLLARRPGAFKTFDEQVQEKGWAREEVRVPSLTDRLLNVFYCYHPTFGYKRSPTIASMLVDG